MMKQRFKQDAPTFTHDSMLDWFKNYFIGKLTNREISLGLN